MQKKKFQDFGKMKFEDQWQKIKEKNKQEDQKTRLLLQSIRITQEKSLQTQKKIQNSLKGAKTTFGDIRSTTEKIDSFKKQYTTALQHLTRKVLLGFGQKSNPFKKQQGKTYQFLPVEIQMKQVVAKMLKSKNILFLTGAGISAESGVPTFRGKGGLYSHKIKTGTQELDPEQVLTKNYYNNRPQVIWNWMNDIRKTILSAKPNQAHILIDKCCKQLVKRKKNVTLVTQNIDNLHIESEDYKTYHIHGDIRYIRCEKMMHLANYSTEQKKCKICESPMRPHILFFDEPYEGINGGEIKYNTYDFVISIGTNLSTNLPAQFVERATQVVEINIQPVIQVGKVYTFKTQAKVALAQMEKYLKIM